MEGEDPPLQTQIEFSTSEVPESSSSPNEAKPVIENDH
jgi:hypothetical protein